jgi:hypothetical protein
MVLLLAGGVIAQEPPPPGSELTVKRAEEAFEEEEVSPPQGIGLPMEVVPEGVAQFIHLSEVPTAEELGLAAPDPFARSMSHIQGAFEQHQEIDPGEEPIDLLTGQPLAPEESPPPTVEELPNATGDAVTAFDGQSYTGWIPPDTVHAVGPNHIVMAVNSGFTVYSKLGTELRSYTTFSSFLHTPTPWNGFMFDPRILFDTQTGRFVMLILGRDDTNRRSWVWTASAADPTGGWWRVRFNVTRNQDTANEAWLDYSGLGVDDHGLYWTGNYFRWSGGFDAPNLVSMNPNLVTGTGTGGGFGWNSLTWPTGGSAFAIQPAHPHNDNGANEMFFVNTFSGSGNKILLWRLGGDRYSGQGLGTTTLTRNEVSLGRTYNAIGMNVDQAGSATDIHGGDARVMNAIYQNRRVYTTLTDDVGNAATSTGAYTVKVNTDNNTVVSEDLQWSGAGTFRFYPAVTVDASGASQDPEVAVYYSWVWPASTANDKYVSAARKIYTTFPSSPGLDVVTKVGEGAYVRLDMNNLNRWGDYSGAAYDFSCDAVTGSIEYAATGNIWKTWIRTDEIGHGGCPQMEVTDPNGGEIWNAGTSRMITWKSVDLTSSGHNIFVFYNDGTQNIQISGPLSPFATSFNWNVPGNPTSNAKVFVGNWNNSTSMYEAFDWSDDDFRITAPDLRVISPNVSKTVLMKGEMFTAGATVNNQGDGSSNVSTTLRYYVSTNSVISTSDTQIGTDPVSALAPGGNSPESATVTAPASTGTFWIGTCVDAVAGESSSSNQCSTGVQITVRPPDNEVVSSQTFTGTSLIDACIAITIGENVTFESGSNTTFQAPEVEVLNNVSWLTSSTSTIDNAKPAGCP